MTGQPQISARKSAAHGRRDRPHRGARPRRGGRRRPEGARRSRACWPPGVRYELGGLYQQQQIAFAAWRGCSRPRWSRSSWCCCSSIERFWLAIIILGCSLLSTTAVFTGAVADRRRAEHHRADGHDDDHRHRHRDGDLLRVRVRPSWRARCRPAKALLAGQRNRLAADHHDDARRDPDAAAPGPRDRRRARGSSSRSRSRSSRDCCCNIRWSCWSCRSWSGGRRRSGVGRQPPRMRHPERHATGRDASARDETSQRPLRHTSCRTGWPARRWSTRVHARCRRAARPPVPVHRNFRNTK